MHATLGRFVEEARMIWVRRGPANPAMVYNADRIIDEPIESEELGR